MKSIFFLLLFFQVSAFCQKGVTNLYVSISGNDNWSGKIASPNKKKSDGPFRSLKKAKTVLEELKKKSAGPIVIMLRGGVYEIEEPLELNYRHSGTVNAPVTWKNYEQEKVELLGGKEIKTFQPVTDASILKRINPSVKDNIVQANLKDLGINDYGEISNRGRPGLELFFNDKRMMLARWPNQGWDTIAGIPGTGEPVFKGDPNRLNEGFPRGRHYGKISYRGDRPSHWTHAEDIFLYGYFVHNWHDEFAHVQSIDTVNKEITIKPPYSRYGYTKGQGYYSVNILEELDQPGEWYLDRTNGYLLFWPPSPVEPAKTFVSLINNPVITLDSTSNVRIEGFSIAYTRGNGIVIKGGENNLVAGCSFHDLGDIAVRIEGGLKNGISSCDLYDLAAGGITLTGGDRKTLTPAANFAVNNHIHHFGQWLKTHQSAITLFGVGNYIAHNLIHHGPNSGITLGGNEHILEYNELHHLGQETADVGAFYMGRNWTQRGNIVRYNYFHDLNGPGENYVNGVYLDDFSSGTTVHGNIFIRCSKGIEVGGGRDNTISNNLFIECLLGISIDARGIDWAKYYFEGKDSTLYRGMDAVNYSKPPYASKYPALLTLYSDTPALPKNNKVINNISYGGRWLRLLYGIGLDMVLCQENLVSEPGNKYRNSKDYIVDGNPGIYDYDKGGLRLDDVSTTKYGFRRLPLEKIGLEKNEFRTDPIKSFTNN